MASLEDILAFKQIFPYLSDEQRKSIPAAIGISIDEINRRMIGKIKEDEFILILLFFDVCKSMSGFDEGLSKLGDKTYTSDLILELKNRMKFLLEIKHTDKERFCISDGNLSKRIEYANSLGLDLYFAISIHGFWMLFSSDYVVSKKGKIGVDDFKNSVLDEVLDTYAYIFPSGIKIRSVYSKIPKKGMDICFEPYGELISYELYYQNRRILRIKGHDSRFYSFIVLLEALQDRLANDVQEITENGDYTIIIDRDEGDQDFNYISEYLFLLAPVMHTKESAVEEKDANTVLNDLKSDRMVPRFPKEVYRGMISELVDLGLPIMYVRKGNIYRLPSKTIQRIELIEKH